MSVRDLGLHCRDFWLSRYGDDHMNAAHQISPLSDLPSGIEALRAEAAAEGFGFLYRLVSEWRSGANRFAQPGEVFLAACQAQELIAVGGLNRDPYTNGTDVGRLRHIYVRKSSRRCGVGSAVVSALLHHADGIFRLVRLKTETPEAARLYISLGFRAVEDVSATHIRCSSSL